MASFDMRPGVRRRRHGAGASARGRVAELQHQRIVVAMAEVTAERGFVGVTVAHVVARAGVSRRTFYELFEDREDCFLAALDDCIAHAADVVRPAYERERRWQDRIRAGLAALLALLDEEPGLAALCVVEALGAGPRALERRARVVEVLVAAIDGGRAAGGATGRAVPPLTAEGVVGAVLAVIHMRMSSSATVGVRPRDDAGKAAPLTGLLSPLMSMIVLPYLGAAAARKEAARPAPAPRSRAQRVSRDPLDGLDMRLTYRTVRVLMATAASPQASNRQIADAAGITDQGQISKLLARLADLGLAENSGEGAVRGAPNAWTLTAKGEHVVRAIRAQTTSSQLDAAG